MRPSGTPQELEQRRLRAARLWAAPNALHHALV